MVPLCPTAWKERTWEAMSGSPLHARIWGREGGKGTPLPSVVHQEVPGAAVPTHGGCTGKPFVEVVGWWDHAGTPLPLASILRKAVCPGEKMGWKMKSSFICSPQYPLLFFPLLKDKIKRFLSVWPFASGNAGGGRVKMKQGLQKGKRWSSRSSSF